jgi:DnaJ like chaperone protein
MSWWGKLVGGALGFALVGPIGALLGAALGHSLDKGIKDLEQADPNDRFSNQEDIQAAFFTATFSIMGHVAKADGRVTESELNVAREIMQKMQLNEEQKKLAINLFTQGKQADFKPELVIQQFKKVSARRSNLSIMFMEIQLSTALADSELHKEEQRVLLNIAELLGFKRREFEQFLARSTAEKFYTRYQSSPSPKNSSQELLQAAYKLLGVNDDCSDSELKKAYRRLMSQHHPDKLVSKGLPEEMMKLATVKTQEIKDAYERIKQFRAQQV